MNNATRLKNIHGKLQQLVKNHQLLKAENERLRQALETSRSELTTTQENLESLKQQVSILKLNAGEMSAADKKEFENRLNRYIREIDRCIGLLRE